MGLAFSSPRFLFPFLRFTELVSTMCLQFFVWIDLNSLLLQAVWIASYIVYFPLIFTMLIIEQAILDTYTLFIHGYLRNVDNFAVCSN